MKSKRLLAALLTLSFTGTGLAACGNKNVDEKNNKSNNTSKVENKKEESPKEDNKDETKEEAKNDKAKTEKDQYLNVLLKSEPKSIDPSRSSDLYSSKVLGMITDGLTRCEATESGDVIEPGIAEKWEYNEDGTVWTFHLRDAKWSDGQPVTAHDFVYGIKRTLDPNTGSKYAWIITPVIKGAEAYNSGEGDAEAVGVKALDDKTLQITLKSPCAYFLDLTYFKVMLPQREDMVEKYGEAFGSEAEHMMACGPFVLKNWEHQSKMEFEKNLNYWDADKVKLQKITRHIIKDENSRMNSLLNGSIDSAEEVTKVEWKEKFKKTGEFDYIKVYQPSAGYEFYNQNNRYFKNAKVRKAFSLAIHREDMAKTIYRGAFEPAYAWCPPTVMIGGEDFRKKSNNDPIKKLMEENPDARELLIKGLKELGEDPDPAKMEVTMLSSKNNARGKEIAEYFQQTLKKDLGVDIKVDYMEWAVFQDRTDNLDYDFASQGWIGDYNDPMTFFEMFTSYCTVTPTGWLNEEYDELIKKASSTMDQEERFKCFKRAEEILLYEDCVIAPKYYEMTSTFGRKFIKNMYTPLFGTQTFKYVYTEGRE